MSCEQKMWIKTEAKKNKTCMLNLNFQSTFISAVQQLHVCFPQGFHSLFQFRTSLPTLGHNARLLQYVNVKNIRPLEKLLKIHFTGCSWSDLQHYSQKKGH